MNDEKLVLVVYHDPEQNQKCCTIGELREGSHHLLLVSTKMEDIDLCSYTVIPRDFIRRIFQLEVK